MAQKRAKNAPTNGTGEKVFVISTKYINSITHPPRLVKGKVCRKVSRVRAERKIFDYPVRHLTNRNSVV